MRANKLDLTAITVESFHPVGGPSLDGLDSSAAHTDLCSVSCNYSCEGTCNSCGYSCQYCETDETDCSTYCFKQTYVWETC